MTTTTINEMCWFLIDSTKGGTTVQGSLKPTYFLTPLIEKNYESFREILDRIGKK